MSKRRSSHQRLAPHAGRLAVTAVVALSLAAACSSGSHTAAPAATAATTTSTTLAPTTTTLPAGYSAFVDAADHVSIAVPATWDQLDPSSASAAADLQQALAVNPQLKSVYPNGVASFEASGTKFMAFSPTSIGGFQANINLIATSAPGIVGGDLVQILPSLETKTESVGGTVTSSFTGTVAGREGLVANISLPYNLASGRKATVIEKQDYVAANNTLYVLTFAGTSAAFSTIESTFSVS